VLCGSGGSGLRVEGGTRGSTFLARRGFGLGEAVANGMKAQVPRQCAVDGCPGVKGIYLLRRPLNSISSMEGANPS